MGQTFRELRIYQISKELSKKIELIAIKLPNKECFKLTDQILRSSRSIPANIAEGFARRKYKKEFAKFLTYALGSSDETQVHLEMIRDNGFVEKEICDELIKKYIDLGVKIFNMRKIVEENN